MAARYGFGGKASVDEDDMKGQPAITGGRYVLGGGYKGKGRNNLRDTLDKFGKVKDFLNHDHTEMVVPTNLSRPGPNKATRPSWPKYTNFGQMMMTTKKEDDDEKGNQESVAPADKAEDSSKKSNNNFCQVQDDVDSIVPNNLGSNPSPNNNVIKPTNYRGTAMDPPKDDKQSYGVNNTPSNKVKESSSNCYTMDHDRSDGKGQGPLCTINFGPKKHSDYVSEGIGQVKKQNIEDNSNKVKDSSGNCIDQGSPYSVKIEPKQHLDHVSDGRGQDPPYTINFGPKQQHSDYGSDDIGQMKKQNMEMGGLNSKASITQDSPPMHRTNGFPNMNWQNQDDESKKNNIRPTPRALVSNKPNMSNGWQDYNYYDDAPLKPQGRYNYNNRAHRWKEITPNPPPQLRYGGAPPNYRPVYRRPVIDSKWAEKKYNGVLLTDN
nr:uncharacterized protein LOC109181758 isoform X1 [Ipomoea batatas]GMD48238.1 uncharacterized protein LOC109181758 isoform X1 [Ipomoea batatas]GMD48239.1 uncharacterized protein LOC109181758 isoform X1 [Ipomoea batatas]